MTTEITSSLRLIETQTSIKAVGDVTITTDLGDLTIQGVKVFQKDGKDPGVGFPQEQWESKVGKGKNYKDILRFNRRLEIAIIDSVLAKYQELCGNG